jgi:methionyl-tRNA formyltransferase
MRLVFCGTPEFAVPSLEAVAKAGHDVQLVVTQPDRPVGRKQEIAEPAVKQAARRMGIEVVQPEKIRKNAEFEARLREIQPDAIAVVAYGRIIPPWMLTLPRLGNINVHGSLLPEYRGAAPIQWALANGETVTGVTTMQLDEGLDTGPMLLQRTLAVGAEETAAELFPRLAVMGAELLVETLEGLEAGSLTPVPQDEWLASLAPLLKREDGRMDFSRTAHEIFNRWRGFQPWPGAYTNYRGEKLIARTVAVAAEAGVVEDSVEGGTLVFAEDELLVACGEGSWLELVEVQLAGKTPVTGAEFVRGHGLRAGERLT